MSEVRMTAEVRTDYDCEATGMPAERWGESVFKIGDEEIVFEGDDANRVYKPNYYFGGGGPERIYLKDGVNLSYNGEWFLASGDG